MQTPAISNQRETWADAGRVSAIILIILQHLCPALYDSPSVGERLFSQATVALTNWCVPLLVMISGTFLLNPNKPFNLNHLFRHNIFRLCAALVFWGTLYGLYACLQKPSGTYTVFSIVGPLFYKRLPWYHLWFIYDILGIYLLVPLLRPLVANMQEKHNRYFIIIFLVATCISAFNLYFPRLNFSIPSLPSLLGFFILGHILYNHNPMPKTRKLIYIASIISVAAIITINLIAGDNPQQRLGITNNPFALIIATAVYVALRNIHFCHSPLITRLAFISFGIYLVHDLFIQLVVFPPSALPTTTAIILKWIIISAISTLTAWALHKIPYLGRLIT